MSLHPFQYGLRHLFVVVALCNVAFFTIVSLSHQGGTRAQIPATEQAVLQAMNDDGLLICDQFR